MPGRTFPRRLASPFQLAVLLTVVACGAAVLLLNLPSRSIDEVRDTQFAIGRGLYHGPITESITSATAGAAIVYTTDGSDPTPSNGTIVRAAGPDADPVAVVHISRTTVLRAAGFKTGYAPTNIDTQTYIMLADVIAQDGTGLPPHGRWGHSGPDWAVDSSIAASPRYRAGISRDLLSIPSLALTVNWPDLFGADGRGIYIRGEDVEKPAVAELILQPGHPGDPFATACTVQVVGATSVTRWRSDKLSLRLKFGRDLRADVFGDDRAVKRFDTLVVDAGFNNHWHYGGAMNPETQRLRAQYVLDQYVADLQLATGGYAPRGRPVFLYLNGLFWGLYMLHERPDADFAAAYLGGTKSDYDVIRHRKDGAVAGSADDYLALITAAGEDMAVQRNYETVTARLDLDDFMRYILINFFVGNQDWSVQNWYATYNRRLRDGAWRFHSWDAERILEDLHHDVTEVMGRDTGGPLFLHSRLRGNPKYRTRFGEIVHALMLTPGAALTAEGAARIYLARLQQIDRAIVPESARWGDNRRIPAYTREEWLARKAFLVDVYFPGRTQVVLRQLGEDGLLPTMSPVTGAVADGRMAAGRVTPGDVLALALPGRLRSGR